MEKPSLKIFTFYVNVIFIFHDCYIQLRRLLLDDGKKLVDFVNVQRQRREQLGKDRQLLLEALPGWTWDPKVREWQESFKNF